MRKNFTFLFIASITIIYCSCTNRNKEEMYPDTSGSVCDTTNITYAGYVSNIMSSNCATSNCHSSSAKQANLDLSAYAGVKSIASDGRLVATINHEQGYSPMPQGQSKLDDCIIDKIEAWVNAGALNN